MSKTIFKHEDEGFTVTIETEAVSKDELIETFANFLKACGFHVGELYEEEVED